MGHQGHSLAKRLGNQQLIERIAVQSREVTYPPSMDNCDRQEAEQRIGIDYPRQILLNRQLALPRLYSDLPKTGVADEALILP